MAGVVSDVDLETVGRVEHLQVVQVEHTAQGRHLVALEHQLVHVHPGVLGLRHALTDHHVAHHLVIS